MYGMWQKGHGLTVALLLALAQVTSAGDWIPRRYVKRPSTGNRPTVSPVQQASWSPPASLPAQAKTAEPFPVVTLGAPVARPRAVAGKDRLFPGSGPRGDRSRGDRWDKPLFRAQNELPQPMPEGNGSKSSPQPSPAPKVMPFQPGPVVSSPPITIGGPVISGPVASPEGCQDCWWGDPSPGQDMWGPVEYFDGPLHNRWTFGAEYLMWWIRNEEVPTPATFGVNRGTNVAAAIGDPSTQVAISGQDFVEEGLNGGRFRFGWWLDPNHIFGIEGVFLYLDEETETRMATSTGRPVLGVPYFNADTGAEAVSVVAGNNQMGTVTASFATRLWGAEGNFRTNWMIGPAAKLDLLIGFRALGLEDRYDLQQQSMSTTTGAAFMLSDQFSTRNRFYGGQIGTSAEWHWGWWSLGLSGKIGVGNTRQSVSIGGSRMGNTTGAVAFTQPSNFGITNRDKVSLVSETSVRLSYQFTKCLQGFVGYNFLYWTNVARPGGQIDRVISPSGATQRPAPRFGESDFWAQGLSLGLEFRY